MFIYKRFFSRIIDIYIFYFFVKLFYVYFIVDKFNILNLTAFFPKFDSYIHCHFPLLLLMIHYAVVPVVILLLLSVVLAFLSAIFKTTPGKAALGIKVLPVPERRGFLARFGFYLWRELRVWALGLGCGFLFITPFFMIWQGLRLRAGKAAVYDRGCGVKVEVRKIRIFVLLFLLPIALLMLGGAIFMFITDLKYYNHLTVHFCNGGYERIQEKLRNRKPLSRKARQLQREELKKKIEQGVKDYFSE